MNGIDLGRGRSFKGLAQYLLHDAAEEEGEKLTTSDRVGWTQSHNLNDADADKAWRLMVATATSADALKKAAGITKVGAKNTKPVYHYTLTWHESETVSDQLQQKAVTESLKALGLDEHQALAIQHLDGHAPHVHVMVNLINPEDGTTAKLSYSHKKLRTFANKFEQEHGLQITEGSRVNEAKRKQGEYPDARRKPRNVYEQEQREGNDRRLSWLRNKEQDRAKELQRQNKIQRQHLETEWTALKETHKMRMEQLEMDQDGAEYDAIQQVKKSFKAKWAKMHKNNRARMAQFEQSEKSAVMQLFTATTTFMEHRKAGRTVFKSLLAATNQAERRAVIEKWNKQDEERMAREHNKAIRAAIRAVKEGYNVKVSDALDAFVLKSKEFEEAKRSMIEAQRQKWREYNQERKQAFGKMQSSNAAMEMLEQNESLRRFVGRKLEP